MNIKEWLDNLAPRERNLVYAGSVVLAALVLYLALWEPLANGRAQLREQVAAQRETLAWMQGAAAQIQSLRGATQQRVGTGQSLLALIDQTARQNELSNAVKRIEPGGQDTVRVWIEDAAFDTLVQWLDLLQQRYGVSVDTITLDRENAIGRVSARITLLGAVG